MGKLDSTLTAETVRELLRYEPDTGIFTWLRDVAQNVKRELFPSLEAKN